MKNGELYKALFLNLINGFAHCQLIYRAGRAVDWTYVVINPAFEQQTGLVDVIGKRASELIPGIHERNPRLLEIYSQVAETRLPQRFEEYVEGLKMWFSVSVYSMQEGTFTAVFENITTIKRMEAELVYKNEVLTRAYDETVASWSSALELRDKDTAGHSKRLAKMTYRVMDSLNYYPRYAERIRYGVLLHDIGKVFIPNSILLKPGPLTDDEKIIMQQHPENAYHILKHVEYLRDVVQIPHYHHERWDGTGYPAGLVEQQIPLEVRIFSVVDTFDAMINDRPYRKALTTRETLTYIEDQSGKAFDPMVVTKFLDLMR